MTGAARGIGRAIAVALARAGANVILYDVAGPVSPVLTVTPATPSDLQETERLVKAEGRKCMAVVGDVRDFGKLQETVAAGEKAWGHLDIGVANAGIQVFKPFLEMEGRFWQDVLDVNLTGVANTLRACAPGMIRRKSGRLIVIASSQGRRGVKHSASYVASKWAVIGLMKTVAAELGEHQITVNAVIPGLVDTPLTRNKERWREAIAEATGSAPENPTEKEAADASKKGFPLGVPWLQPEDIAPAVAFLASDAARMVSGATYDVTAGYSTHYNA